MLVGNKTTKTLLNSVFRVKPAVTSQKSLIANIERLRILSASAVVCFHTHTNSAFARSLGTVGFLILLLCLCVFVVNRQEPYGLADLLRRKAHRLLGPWLFWSLIYGGLGVARVIYKDVPFSDAFPATMLLTGTRIHLWFLPFAFVAALLLVLIHRKITDVPDRVTIIAASSIGALCLLGCSIVQSRIIQSWVQPPVPLPQWILGLPAIPIGFAIGRIILMQRAEERRNLYIFVILSTLAAYVVVVALTQLNHAGIYVIRYCVSAAIVCAALHWRGNLDSISRKLGSLSYGIYLVHPLILVFLDYFEIAVQRPLVLLFLAVSISGLITFILKKTPMKRFV